MVKNLTPYQDLIKLPGIGDYTAKTILSIAFEQPFVGIDTNLERVGYRILGLKSKTKRNHKRVVEFLEANQDKNRPGDYNEALMDLGSSICSSQTTYCTKCPLAKDCKAYVSLSPTSYPKSEISKKVPEHNVAVSLIKYKNKFLITRRSNTKFLSGLWEFPGGKIEKSETARQAIIREVKEETNLIIFDPIYLGNVKHKYSHFGVNISLFISSPESIKKLNIKQEHKWIDLKSIDKYPLPKANHKMLDILKKFH